MTKVYQKRGLDRLTDDTPIAKCGHPSRTRYFKCEDCVLNLPRDTDYLYMGSSDEALVEDDEVENEFEDDDTVMDEACWE